MDGKGINRFTRGALPPSFSQPGGIPPLGKPSASHHLAQIQQAAALLEQMAKALDTIGQGSDCQQRLIKNLYDIACKKFLPTTKIDKEFFDQIIEKLPNEALYLPKERLDEHRARHWNFNGQQLPDDLVLGLVSKIDPNIINNYRTPKIEHQKSGVLDTISTIFRSTADPIRTRKFLERIAEVTDTLSKRLDTVEVIDAGCGPLPIMGIYAALCSDKAKVTCLETNPQSAAIARNIISNLGLENRIKIIEADATKYQHDKKVNLLISETLNTALMGESFTNIMDNFRSQLSDESTLIPESIIIHCGLLANSLPGEQILYLVTPDKTMWSPRGHRFEEVLISKQHLTYNPKTEQLERIKFSLPVKSLPKGSYEPLIYLTVNLGGNKNLGINECGFTVPQAVVDPKSPREPYKLVLKNSNHRKNTLELSYRPSLEYFEGGVRIRVK